MSDPENELIPIPEVRERVPSWPYSPPRTYQLARGIGDGRPALATVRIGKRRYVTRRALAEFLEARLDDTPSEPKRLSPETLAKRRATRAANRAAKAANAA